MTIFTLKVESALAPDDAERVIVADVEAPAARFD